MNFLGKLFGGSGKQELKGEPTDNAISRLREVENLLIKKQEFYEKKVEAQFTLAIVNASKNKQIALQALKRRNHYKKELQRIDGTLTTLEMQREALEGATTNMAVVQTMKDASDALKVAHQHMNIDQVHDMMDEIGEQQDLSREIAEAISNPVAFGANVDEDELEEEFERLQQEMLDDKLLDVTLSSVKLPEVITENVGKPTARKTKQEDDDMEQLTMWAS